MNRSRRGALVALLVLGPVGTLVAQSATPRPLSLEEALTLAVPASEGLELAKAAVLRARGEEYRAGSERWPQLSATLGYTRQLKSQFEGIDFGGNDTANGGNGDFSDLPFGQRNTYSLGLSISQSLFTGGRIRGQTLAADAGRRSAEFGVTSAEAQLTLDVVTGYYDAVLADRQLSIAETALAQADTTLRQTQARRAVGTQPEFDVLRARVARDNQRTAVIQRRTDRDLAHVRLKQLLNLPLDDALALSTDLEDTSATRVPTLARVLDAEPDTAAEHRLAVRQGTEAVRAQEGLLRVARAQQIPSLVFTSQYGRVGYPAGFYPGDANYFTNWNLNLGLQLPLFTGGRIRGEKMAAEAAVREAELQLQQTTEAARLDARLALFTLDAAEASWEASQGTVEQAQRAYEIAEIRFREGISTQTELLDARLALETARTQRAQAARELQVARVRMALIGALPLPGAQRGVAPPPPGQVQPQPGPAQPNPIPGTTGITP
jgi:outer membrane protein TolC